MLTPRVRPFSLLPAGERASPALEPLIDPGIAVAIDGTIYRDTWSKELPPGAEIFLLPRLMSNPDSLKRWGKTYVLNK